MIKIKRIRVYVVALVFCGISACGSASKKPSVPAAGPAPSPTATPAAKAVAKGLSKRGIPLEQKCRLGDDVRLIVAAATDHGCELRYTKFGEMKVVASSTEGWGHCDQVQDKIRTNLEAAGFKCD